MSPNTMTLRNSRELLVAVPYLLGFYPQNSLVVLTLRRSRLGLTARVDLPEREQPRALQLSVESLMPAILREAPDTAVLIAYEDAAGDAVPVLVRLSEALRAHGVDLKDRIVVSNGRWRSLDCDNPACCPTEGTPVPASRDAAAVTAEFVGAGVAPHATRQDLARMVEASDGARPVGRLLGAPQFAASPAMSPEEVAAVIKRVLVSGGQCRRPSSEDVARAALAVRDVQVRDVVAAWVCPGTVDAEMFEPAARELLVALAGISPSAELSGEALRERRDRLLQVCTMLPDAHATAWLTILASFSWWRGEGALTRVALDRALRSNPDYGLALLLERMVDLGIRPPE
ncbi:DUF4192 domain-containing protein [Lapillicoccus jejuensis]|uniref:Uncharacterized protein DUF4192 n=1 Tax=Lapillicoccus jejuensis TaxID=402171 RepID=A0A542DVU1_9MICO|nr:DUF4192 domain-containing protein [Lapillicoccus jejuensis]TQJ07221.1 uncharacterized protein DUF4192 [Lapillicoccus jejuensis]